MSRPVTLCTGQWADLPVDDLARMMREFGFDGLELACWGDHFEVDKAMADESYVKEKRELLDRHDMQCHAISAHLVGQAVCDVIDERHQAILPDYIWGDGDPAGVNERAAEEMKQTARAAQRFGVDVVNGFTGSSIWHLLYSFPPVPESMIDKGYDHFAACWNPILDVFAECGVKFALEVHPTEIAFDIYSTKRALEAIGHREEFGFNFDPSHLLWQGVDPVEFIREFGDRIYHVHMKDAIVTLDGRTGILGSHINFGRCPTWLGFPLGWSRWREFRRDHPCPQRHRLQRASKRRMGRRPYGSRAWCQGIVRIREEARFCTFDVCVRRSLFGLVAVTAGTRKL